MACCCKFKLNNRNYEWIRWFRLIPQLGELLYMCFMKVLGPLMFGAANILILAVAVLFQLIITPELAGGNSGAYLFRSLVHIYLVVNIFYNYYSCAFTHAGSPPSCPDPGRVLGEKCSVIDGERVFVRGGNMVPLSVFNGQQSPTLLFDRLVGAGIDTVRVWGGGVYQGDEFYREADRRGVMVWQELMFACSLYPADDR